MGRRIMNVFREAVLLLILFMHGTWGQAAYWIVEYDGEPQDYQVIREGRELDVESQLLLEENDQVKVITNAKQLIVENDDDGSRVVLTSADKHMVVPAAEEPPGVIVNMINLIKDWVGSTKNNAIETRTMASRGDGIVLLLGVSDIENKLFSDTDHIAVFWEGGRPPYTLLLLDEDENRLWSANDISAKHTVVEYDKLLPGRYGIEVKGESSTSYISLLVVDEDKAPDEYREIMSSTVPVSVKRKAAVVSLAQQEDWVFQALQLTLEDNMVEMRDLILKNIKP